MTFRVIISFLGAKRNTKSFHCQRLKIQKDVFKSAVDSYEAVGF